MAEFNPEVPEGGIDDRASQLKVPTPDTSGGTMLGAFGDLFSGIVKTKNTFTENSIVNDVRYNANAVTEDFGLSPPAVTGNTPADIQSSQKALAKLQMASNQGKVTPEYYYQRLAATMKGLRAKYPGYEQEVDQAFSRVTGMNPANAYRDALISNMNSADAQMKDNQGKIENYVTNNSQYMTPQESEDWFKNGGGNFGGAQGIASNIAKKKAAEQTMDSNVKEANLQGQQSEANFQSDANTIVSNVIIDTTKASMVQLGQPDLGTGNFQQTMQKLSAAGGATPEQKAQLTQALQAMHTQVYNNLVLHRTQYNHLDPTKAKSLIDSALEPLDNIQKQIDNNDFSGALRSASTIQLQQNKDTQQLYKDANMLRIKTLSSIDAPTAGTVMANYFQQAYGGPEGYLKTTVRQDLAEGPLSGDSGLSHQVDNILGNTASSQVQKTTQVQQLVKDYSALGPKIPQDAGQVGRVVQQNYPIDPSKDRLWQVVQSDQKLSLFGKLYNPEITKKITASGNVEALHQYADSAMARMQSIPEFSKTAAALGSVTADSSFQMPTWNPKTNRLEIQVDKAGLSSRGYLERSQEAATNTQMQAFVDKFNQGMTIMGPIFKAEGVDPAQGVKQMFQQFNTNLENGKATGFFARMNRGLDVLLGNADPTFDGAPGGPARPPDWDEQKHPSQGGLGESDQGESKGTQNETPAIPELNLTSLNKIQATLAPKTEVDGTTLDNDVTPEKSGLANIIGVTEGTGNNRDAYDVTFGNNRYSGDAKVTDMSIGEVKNLQQDMLARGSGNTPVGKFQINAATLADYQKKLDIPDDVKLTPEVQNHIFEAIVHDAGYDDWKAGKLPGGVFLERLRGRWPSLPGGSQDTRKGISSDQVLGALSSPGTAPGLSFAEGSKAAAPRSTENLVWQGRAPGMNSYNDGHDVDSATNFLQSVVAPDTGAARPDAVTGLQPAMRTRLQGLIQSAPDDYQGRIGLFSGYRSPEVQKVLFENSDRTGHMVARPGGSQHNFGTAVDLAWKTDDGKWVSLAKAPKAVKAWVASNAEEHNLKLPMDYEPWHVELGETRNFGYVGDKAKKFAGRTGGADDQSRDTSDTGEAKEPSFQIPLQDKDGNDIAQFAGLMESDTGGVKEAPRDAGTAPIGYQNMKETVNFEDRRDGNLPDIHGNLKAFNELDNEEEPDIRPTRGGSVYLTDNYAFFVPKGSDKASAVPLGTRKQWEADQIQQQDGSAMSQSRATFPADNPLAQSVDDFAKKQRRASNSKTMDRFKEILKQTK